VDCPPACLNCRTAGRDDYGRTGRLWSAGCGLPARLPELPTD